MSWLTDILDDDVRFQEWRRRILFGLVAIGILMTAQTTLIYSPRFLIGALYHGRGVGFHEFEKMSPAQRDKTLRRLNDINELYKGKGGLHLP